MIYTANAVIDRLGSGTFTGSIVADEVKLAAIAW